jgi:hypothetical protein
MQKPKSKSSVRRIADAKASAPQRPRREISEDAIAARAYERWQQRGCPLWQDEQDWFAARTELELEAAAESEPSATKRAG